jgi:hypothetical protein
MWQKKLCPILPTDIDLSVRVAPIEPLQKGLHHFCSKFGFDKDTTITTLSGSMSGFAATFAKQPIQRVKWIRQARNHSNISSTMIVMVICYVHLTAGERRQGDSLLPNSE